MNPGELAAAGLEIALLVAGIALTGWLFLSARGRGVMVTRLAAWDLPPMDFACFLCCALVGAIAVSEAAALVLGKRHLSADAGMVVGGAALHAGVLAGLAGFFVMYGARGRGAPGPLPRLPAALSGLLTFAAAIPIVDGTSLAWEKLIEWLGLPDDKQDMVDILENSHSAALKLLLVVVAVLIVPITEEAVFRAGLFRFLRTRIPRWAAIALTSALFASLHVHWGGRFEGLVSAGPLFALAVIFCLAYERTGNIGTTMVAHALFNLNTFILVAAGVGT